MTDIKELKNKKKDIILNLGEEELEAYILSLSQNYYVHLMKGDDVGLENVIESLETIVEINDYRYGDIHDYINYCFVISSNKILKKVFDLNCRLWIPIDKSIASDSGFMSLTESMERSRKKIINEESDVKELYEMVLSDESIDEAIIDKVTEVYNAFKIFNYGREL